MKLILALAVVTAANAFTTSPGMFAIRGKTSLQSARPDASSLIAEAMAASKTFGASSVEARLAWEAVEEMDSADNSASFAGSLDDECEMDSPSKACEEYSQKLEELSALLENQGPKIEQIKSLAREIQAVKIKEAAPSQGRVADSPALQAIIKAAKAATEKFGATSPEATVAWAEVEDVAAASSKSNALGGMLGDECLVETIEACDALEELQRAIQVTSSDPAYRA